MARRSLAVRSFALLTVACLGLRALPASASGDLNASLAHQAMAMWTQAPHAPLFFGFDGDDGVRAWQAAYPDGGLFAYGHILHVAGRPDVVDSSGPRFLLAEYRAAFPDFRLTVDDLQVDGDRATVRWTLGGTSLGPFDGLTPTGQRFQEDGAFIFRVAGDQIDASLRQAGAAPLPLPQPWNPPAPIVTSAPPSDAPTDPDFQPYIAA